MIVVHKGNAKIKPSGLSTPRNRNVGHILECSIFLIVKEQHPVVTTYGQVRSAIVVIVADCTAEVHRGFRETCLNAYIFKPVSEIVEQAFTREEQIDVAVAVVVKPARPGP